MTGTAMTDLVEERGGFRVSAALRRMGDDMVVVLEGGKPHIGAVGMAQPRPSLADAGKVSATSSVYTFPGHREDDVAKTMAQELSRGLECRVVVIAGLHWDRITPEGIEEVIGMCRGLTARIMEEARKK
ncbi:MAG: hypothetical protein PHC90_01885 [Syntrophorhabdaceae bacterium]|nr:hypothetical protein [Syntrophorhabdaceae bacterium]